METLPCPFCGRNPRVKQVHQEGKHAWEVMCIRSAACPVTVYAFGETREQAIGRWNRRKA